jgi:nucleoside-diphosphate-sugar epimerase
MDPADGRLLVNFIGQALRGEPLTVYGDGRQTRSLCHVGDLVRGLVAMMERPGLAGEIVNLGNPDERTIADFARIVQAACGTDLPIEFRALPADDPTRRCPDIAKARRLLGWEPAVGLDEGLRRMVDHFRATMRPTETDTALVAAA